MLGGITEVHVFLRTLKPPVGSNINVIHVNILILNAFYLHHNAIEFIQLVGFSIQAYLSMSQHHIYIYIFYTLTRPAQGCKPSETQISGASVANQRHGWLNKSSANFIDASGVASSVVKYVSILQLSLVGYHLSSNTQLIASDKRCEIEYKTARKTRNTKKTNYQIMSQRCKSLIGFLVIFPGKLANLGVLGHAMVLWSFFSLPREHPWMEVCGRPSTQFLSSDYQKMPLVTRPKITER